MTNVKYFHTGITQCVNQENWVRQYCHYNNNIIIIICTLVELCGMRGDGVKKMYVLKERVFTERERERNDLNRRELEIFTLREIFHQRRQEQNQLG